MPVQAGNPGLAPVLLALVVEELGATRLAARGAGLLLAIQPIALRSSGDMSRVSHVLFLATLALWALARHEGLRRGRDLVPFVASAWLCCRTRPEAGVVLLMAGQAVVVVHLDGWRGLRERAFHREMLALILAGGLGVGGIPERRLRSPRLPGLPASP